MYNNYLALKNKSEELKKKKEPNPTVFGPERETFFFKTKKNLNIF